MKVQFCGEDRSAALRGGPGVLAAGEGRGR
jgi:hypothetical protein